MKKLFPKQDEALQFFLKCQREGRNTLDTSHVGTGKTVVACHLAHSSSLQNVAVICPKAVIPSWEREMRESGLNPLFVLNYEKIRTGRTKWMSKRGKKIMTWELPKDTLVLVDEVHKCKSPYTQNAQMLISLVSQGYRVHAMSATAAEDPTEMRSLGYMLGLHSLNRTVGVLRSWYSWMQKNGCKKDFWNQWQLSDRSKLRPLRHKMYGTNVKKLTIHDFPDSFKENRVFVEPIQFDDHNKIIQAYDDLGITPEIIEQYIEHGTVEDSEYVLVNILRARQLAESFKVKDFADMARELEREGNNVVLFVNFRETALALCEALKCKAIIGGQSAEERQQAIDEFQADESSMLVVNIAAGGTGLSLHDINGKCPRVSLISPTFNVKDHLQALGRIHRNGAKSDALQKILVASGSIEEAVMKAIGNKTKNLQELHDEEPAEA